MNKEYISPYPKGFQHPGSWKFSIGTYGGNSSVCVTLHCGKIGDDGYESFHMHDDYGIFPRFIRIGLYAIILRSKAVKFYSKIFPEWELYLTNKGEQPLLEFQK